MLNLNAFERDLRDLIGCPSTQRPFVCDGSPLKCQAIIVGFNPATEMTTDFWQFWRSNYGFDKSAWLARYLADRQSRPLSLGKTRRPAMSNTRRVVQWILEEAQPVACLETNLHARATEQATDLPQAHRTTETIEFLLDRVRPRLIVAHGKDATAYVRSLGSNAPHRLEVPHFSRGWSQADARALGKYIRQLCCA